MTIKQMESRIKKLKKQAAKIDNELFRLDCKLHDAKVDAEKLRLAKKRIAEETPKYRKKKYRWLPRGVQFENIEGSVPCEYCGWPVSSYTPDYRSADCGVTSWFHDMGKWGEMPKGCDNATPAFNPSKPPTDEDHPLRGYWHVAKAQSEAAIGKAASDRLITDHRAGASA